ncbi:SUR7/PalI family-domain-containing protein [Cadophora sp. MPI-SDFR-AT-0126]|nr:SUR7/PalI family-domain-containing protein [Leotiomycetes sp. MPI-SDFR-AT-0126]
MAKTGIFHHVGTFLLLAASVLLVITTISAPIINSIPILKVNLANGSDVSFGTFGYCILNVDEDSHDYCSGRHIGYNPANIMTRIENTDFGSASENTSEGLTRVMVLHPVACALSFIAFLLALGSGFIGALFASLVSALAFVVTIIVMATDFTSFAIIKNHINGDGSGSKAHYSTGMWTCLAAMVCLFLATFVVLFTCCSSRMHKQRDRRAGHVEKGYVGNGTHVRTKRHFWQRKSRTTTTY